MPIDGTLKWATPASLVLLTAVGINSIDDKFDPLERRLDRLESRMVRETDLLREEMRASRTHGQPRGRRPSNAPSWKNYVALSLVRQERSESSPDRLKPRMPTRAGSRSSPNSDGLYPENLQPDAARGYPPRQRVGYRGNSCIIKYQTYIRHKGDLSKRRHCRQSLDPALDYYVIY